jgi:hypothetical protein
VYSDIIRRGRSCIISASISYHCSATWLWWTFRLLFTKFPYFARPRPLHFSYFS